MHARSLLALTVVLAAGCLRAAPAGKPPLPTARPSIGVPAARIEPARILPDLPRGLAPAGIESDGSRRYLHLRMRLLERPDGSVECAPGLLPAGRSRILSLELPERFGSAFLFAASSASSTQIWKVSSWLGALEPILRIEQPVQEILVGSDRAYVRTTRATHGFIAFDPADGRVLEQGQLPEPSRYGPVLFVDAWRGVVVTDLRGPLATFDAGMSWAPLGLHKPIRSLTAMGDRIILDLDGSAFALDPQGRLTAHSQRVDVADSAASTDTTRSLAERLFGDRPLRVAIARGVPLTRNTAVFAHSGHLGFVSTSSGSLLRVARDAYPASYTECQGVRLGPGVGFVCGERQGATAVFAYDPPSTLKPVLHYREPRAVFPSGNGALVVRAPCPGTDPIEGQAQYCLRDAQGRIREVRFQGDLGAERVVALADGRVMIVIAPRPGAEGRLVVLQGDRATTHALTLDKLSRRPRALIQRGLWMHGAVEVAPGVVGLWVEAGGPVLGIRIDDKGHVSAGAIQSPPGSVFVSGLLGVVWRSHGSALETTDGGMSWKEFELPTGQAGPDALFRGCSAVGCVVDGWLRVGWGGAGKAEALEAAPESRSPYRPSYSSAIRQSYTCTATGRSSPPPAPAPRPPVRPAAPQPRPYPGGPVVPPDSRSLGWLPFDAAAAPPLGPDEVGLGAGRDYGDFRFRAYAWGPKAVDWTRSGRWLLRFDDPYNAVAPPHASAVALSPWIDLLSASLRLNSVRSALIDPDGRSTVLEWCPVSNQCHVFGVTAEEAPVELTLANGDSWPNLVSMIRTREAWYLLGQSTNRTSTLYIADRNGQARVLATYPRVRDGSQDDAMLVRRVHRDGVALSLRSYDGKGASSLVLMPVDVATGDILDAVRILAPAGAQEAEACTPGQEGWLIEKPFLVGPVLRMPDGTPFGGSIRGQWVVEGGRVCVRALSARATVAEVSQTRQRGRAAAVGTIPLAVWEPGERRKYEMLCAASH